VILAVLAAIVIPKFSGRTQQAKEAAAKTQIKSIELALDSYEVDTGGYPQGSAGLNALVDEPNGVQNWKGPYLKQGILSKILGGFQVSSTFEWQPGPLLSWGNLFFYGIGPSYRLINGERFRLAPVIEIVGWNVTGGLQTGTPSGASGINVVNLKIGARMGFGGHSSLYVGYGKALTSADWYDQIVRVEYRYSF
jgi:type II secretion system protein G